MLEQLIEQDHLWFYTVHFEWTNEWLDQIFPYLRNPYFWAPLYLFLLFYTLINYKLKGLYWSVFYVITFGIADYFSASIIKPWVARVRPCNDPLFADIVRDLVHCGSGFSFPSTHATNHFAMAIFIALTIGRKKPLVWIACLIWAASIAYAQVYVGVHYPVDVMGGAIIGIIIGIITGGFFNNIIKLRPKIKKVKKDFDDAVKDTPTFI
jgi:membrane-associated phospholipid phosphatase